MANGAILNQTQGNSLLLDGTKAMEAALNMGNNRIINLAKAVNNNDAVNLSQLTASNTKYSNSSTSSVITSGNVQGAIDQLFGHVSDGKALIADAITDKGVSTSSSATFQTMANNIGRISANQYYRTSIIRRATQYDPAESGYIQISVNIGSKINEDNYRGTICILETLSGPHSGADVSFQSGSILGFSCYKSSNSYFGSLMVAGGRYNDAASVNVAPSIIDVQFRNGYVDISYDFGGSLYWGPDPYGVTNPEDYRYEYVVISWGL